METTTAAVPTAWPGSSKCRAPLVSGRAAAPFSAQLSHTPDRYGIKPGDTVVAYCHVGQQGTAVVFAARLLGHPVRLYDGSFQDWAVNVHGPVEP